MFTQNQAVSLSGSHGGRGHATLSGAGKELFVPVGCVDTQTGSSFDVGCPFGINRVLFVCLFLYPGGFYK